MDGSTPASGLSVQVGSGTGTYDTMTVAISSITAGSLGVAGSFVSSQIGGATALGIKTTGPGSQLASYTASTGVALLDAAITAGAITINITNTSGTDRAITYTPLASEVGSSGVGRDSVAGKLADLINQANLGMVAVASTDGTGKMILKKGLDVSSNSAATASVNAIDTALATVNTQRAKLGATSNRLDSTIANLTNVVTNLSAGKGRIEDADFASESTNMARAQILQQAATAMLAQANSSKQGVLQLLQR